MLFNRGLFKKIRSYLWLNSLWISLLSRIKSLHLVSKRSIWIDFSHFQRRFFWLKIKGLFSQIQLIYYLHILYRNNSQLLRLWISFPSQKSRKPRDIVKQVWVMENIKILHHWAFYLFKYIQRTIHHLFISQKQLSQFKCLIGVTLQ